MSQSLRNTLLASLVLLGTACVTASGGQQAQSGQKAAAAKPQLADDLKRKQVHCEMERPVGSNIPVEVCENEDDADADRDTARQIMNNAARMGSQGRLGGN